MFASFIPAIADILGKRQIYGGYYEGTVGIRLQNISGNYFMYFTITWSDLIKLH